MKQENHAVKVYGKRQSFGDLLYSYFSLTPDPDFELVANEVALSATPEGDEFLRANFKPGDLIETKLGIHMLDTDYCLMMAGYHQSHPQNANRNAGLV